MIPVFKKENTSFLENYRPVSALPVVSEIYEKIMHKQILDYIGKHLSAHVCGYRKGCKTQTSLIPMHEVMEIIHEQCIMELPDTLFSRHNENKFTHIIVYIVYLYSFLVPFL